MNSDGNKIKKTGKKARWIFFFILVGCFGLLILGAMVLVFVILPNTHSSQSNVPLPAKTLAPNSLYLGEFSPVQGTSYLIAEVNREYHSIGSGSARINFFSYDSDGGDTHNLVFLDNNTLVTHRLFDTNVYHITNINQFPEPDTGQDNTDPARVVTVRCLVYQVAQTDSNHDGVLDRDDLLAIAMTDAGGNGYSELFNSVANVYWMKMTDPNTLVIVYQQGDSRKVSRIDINSHTVTATQPLVDLGQEVK